MVTRSCLAARLWTVPSVRAESGFQSVGGRMYALAVCKAEGIWAAAIWEPPPVLTDTAQGPLGPYQFHRFDGCDLGSSAQGDPHSTA